MTNQHRKILLFDDDPDQAIGWRDELEPQAGREVEGMNSEEFLDCIRILEERRARARSAETIESFSELSEKNCKFDEVGILIVDYDLLEVDRSEKESTTYLTGEDVAYLVRCYSTCDVIVALNQFGSKTFDLRLQGHPHSFADLNVGSDHFANSGLWGEDWKEFRPWEWPILPKLETDFAARLADLRQHLDTPILEFLGLSRERVGVLPREVSEFLETKEKDHSSVTFHDFVLGSGQGLRPKDKTSIDNIQRMAAARISRWLECFVLAGQDILVDAPHLASRFPSLLRTSPMDLESWNRTTSLKQAEGLDQSKIEKQRFTKSHWLSRPAWYWNEVRENRMIGEVSDPWNNPETIDCVFCEDTSQFELAETTKQFVSDVPSPFQSRYVKKLAGVDYRPPIRFAL